MLLTISIIFFTLGILISIIPRIWKDIWTLKFLAILGIIIFIGFLSFYDRVTGADSGTEKLNSLDVMMVIMLAAMFLVSVFLDRFLPTINEMVIVVNTILFWYLQLVYQFWPMKYFAIPLIFSALVVVISFTSWKLPKPVKLFLFVWNLLILLSIFLLYYESQWGDLLSIQETVIGNTTGAFFLGMIYVTFLTNFVPIISLIPSKHGGNRVIETAKSMVNKFTDEQVSHQALAMILLVSVSVLGLNLTFGLISDLLLVNMVAVILPLIVSFMGSGSFSHKDAAVTIEKR